MRGMLPLAAIDADPRFNARKGRDERAEDEARIVALAKSLEESGLLNDVLVRDRGEDAPGKRYALVHGFRRYEAARRLGWEKIACKARVYEDDLSAEIDNLAENVARDDLSPYDFARRAQDMHRRHGASYEAIGKRLGTEPGWVELQVRCLERLPIDLIEAFRRSDKSKLTVFLSVARETGHDKMRATYNRLVALSGPKPVRERLRLSSGVVTTRVKKKKPRKEATVVEVRERVVSGELARFHGRELTQRERDLALGLIGWFLGRQDMPLDEFEVSS